jgi:tetratricopeptide (TPR) repeat protein
MLRIFLALILLIAPTVQAAPFVHSPAYVECSTLAGTNPQEALKKADGWLKMEKNIAANHCRAMALYGLKRYGESASALRIIYTQLSESDDSLRTYVARQAAKAYDRAEQPKEALAMLSKQLDALSNQQGGDNAVTADLATEILIDRANLRASYGQYTMAIQDLDHATSLTPANDLVLTSRARVFIALGDSTLAKQDLQAVLRANPNQAEARAMMTQLRTQ